jgi:hypothetical protein
MLYRKVSGSQTKDYDIGKKAFDQLPNLTKL